MFEWFKRKMSNEPRVFADNREAFAYACEKLDNAILLEAVIPALVEEEGETGPEGERWFRLLLAAKEGGREHWGCTLKEATQFPNPGDLVGFRIVQIAPDLPEGMNIVGYIAVKLAPVLVGKKGWRIAQNLTPDNIRKTVRW